MGTAPFDRRRLIPNQPVRLELEHSAGNLELEGMVVREDPDQLLIGLTDVDEAPPVLEPGRRAVLKLWDHTGVLRAPTRVLSVPPAPPLAVAVQVPTSYERNQSRRYFRLITSADLTFEVRRGRTTVFGPTRANTFDVSAGGFRFETDLPLQLGDRLLAQLAFPTNVAPAARNLPQYDARVVWLRPAPGRPGRLHVGCELENLPERERDRLVQVIIQLQTRLRGQSL